MNHPLENDKEWDLFARHALQCQGIVAPAYRGRVGTGFEVHKVLCDNLGFFKGRTIHG